MPKRIAIISPGFLPVPDILGGGVEQLVTKIVAENSISGDFSIDLYTIANQGLKNIKPKSARVVQIYIPKHRVLLEKLLTKICFIFNKPFLPCDYGKKCADIIEHEQYDYIIVENNMYVYEKVYKRMPSNRYIFHLHNDIGGVDKPVRLCRFIGETAVSIWGCSDFIAKRFFDMTHAGTIRVLMNAIDTTLYHYNVDAARSKRKDLGIRHDDFLFLYVGRIGKEKGVLELVKSFSKVPSQKVRLCIVGDMSPSSHYARLVQKTADDDNRILFTGQKPSQEVAELICASDCVVIPTLCNEAFGLVAAQSMACRRCIITTGTGGLSDLVSNGSAFIVPPGHQFLSRLSETMNFASNHSVQVYKMGQSAYETFLGKRCVDDKTYFNHFKKLLMELYYESKTLN